MADVKWPSWPLAPYLLLSGRVWASILPNGIRDKSWLVSTNIDNPFLIASNWYGVVIRLYSGQMKEIFDRLFLKKISLKIQGIKQDIVLGLLLNISSSGCDAWLCLSTKNCNLSMAEEKDGKDLEHRWCYCTELTSGVGTPPLDCFLWWKMKCIFKPVDLGCSLSDNWRYKVTLL